MYSTPPPHLALGQGTLDFRESMGEPPPTFFGVWIYFNLVSNTILLPILVFTILVSNQLRRHPTFINICLTWIVSGIFSLLLFFAHGYKDGPPKPLCIAQASLIYGVIPTWAVAVFALFYYMYQCLQGRSQEAEFGTVTSWLMFVAPYLCHIVFFIAALVTSLRHPNLVSRESSFFYCHLHYRPLALVRTTFVSLCSASVIVIEFLLLHKIYRNHSSTRGIPTTNQNESLQSLIRIGVFGVYLIFGAAADLLAVIDPRTILPQVYVATAGTVVFLVFGTQTDVLRVWFPFIFRQRKPKKVLSRPFRGNGLTAPCGGLQSCLSPCHTTHPGTSSSSTRACQPPSEHLSFSLDDLFPKSPTPARTAPPSFPYIQHAI